MDCHRRNCSLLAVLLLGELCCSTLLPNPVTGYLKSSYFLNEDFSDNAPKIKAKISNADIKKSLAFGTMVVDRLHRLETNLKNSDITVKNDTAAHIQSLDSRAENEALAQGRKALIASHTSVHLMNSFCSRLRIRHADCAKALTQFKLNPTNSGSTCDAARIPCNTKVLSFKYRSQDGSCNHFSDMSIGESFTQYARLVFPEYGDGIHTPRRSVTKRNSLPSPRIVSSKLVKHNDRKDKMLTMAVMQWGQFISHDLYHTTSNKMLHSGESIQCCSSNGRKLPPRYNHPLCSPITIPSNDEFYSKHNQLCMTYVRSVPAVRSDCSLGPLEQLNQVTHYIDGSQIYGSHLKKSKSLRSGSGGKLKMSKRTAKGFLPVVADPLYNCPESNKESCFEAGDSRVNSQPQLTAMHTIWNREHNRIASELSKLNPHWNDEKLFQETRRIIIAMLQHITYSSWLPKILNRKQISKIMGFTSFNDAIDPSISNSFATAAFRFLKSLMVGDINLVGEDREVNSTLKLAKSFNRPETITNGVFDSLIRGMSSQKSQKADFSYTEDVTNLMYGNGKSGFDIVSLDIQRGRDHGLPSYTKFRTLCGLPAVQTFKDLTDFMTEQDVNALSQVYKDPQDVDLLVGGMLETGYLDSLLGPTFSCIITDQFLRTRSGDRFFYTFSNQPHPFTKQQFDEIRKVTLARIFCDNSDSIKFMQADVFNVISKRNDLMECNSSSIPKMNLDRWRE